MNEHAIFRLLNPVLGDWRKAVAVIRGGLDPNLRDESGEPLLIHAARSGSWEAFAALIEAGASSVASSPEGITAFHYAVAGMVRPNLKGWSQRQIGGSKKMVAYYAEHERLGTTAKAMLALARNKLAAFRDLLLGGLHPDTRIEDPLRLLLISDQKKHIAAWLEDRNRKAAGQSYPAPPTLLMWAAGLGRAKFVELLISQGADQDARDDLGYTASDYAEIQRTAYLP